jgi:hypothetical protein
VPREIGHKFTNGARRRAIRQLQSLVAAGVSDAEARESVMKTLDISGRTARYWLATAYEEMARDAEVDRRELVGLALKRRRIAAARALRDGDTRAYLAACDSESRLLGLDAPARTQHTVLVEQVAGMSKVMTDVVKEYFADDPSGRERFVSMLRARVNAQLAARPEKPTLVIDAGSEEVTQIASGNDEPVEASEARIVAPIADLAPTAAPTPDAPPPA